MKIGKHDIDGKACIMGVLNVTPDSFSDGGSYTSVEKALEQADKMITEGAKIMFGQDFTMGKCLRLLLKKTCQLF